MSQVGVTLPNLYEGFPVTSLTILVLSLIPCVVILLLLNCLFLGYKLFIMLKNKRKSHEELEMRLHSCLSTRHRVARITEGPFFPSQERRIYASMSEPVLHRPVTSSRTSSRGRGAPVDHGMRFLRPDGATGNGSGSLRSPSTILADAYGCTPRADLPRTSKILDMNRVEWCKSAPLLPLSTFSDLDTRSNLVPPNTPAHTTKSLDFINRSSRPTLELWAHSNRDVTENRLDKVDLECEYAVRHESGVACCLYTSMVGPGLDSDFGASAGVSLRIVSADSDGLSSGVLSAALEWDYYDPCYVQQNGVPIQNPNRPAMNSRQYWV